MTAANPTTQEPPSGLRTGVLLSLAATVFASLYFIPFKVASQQVPRELAILVVLLCAAVFNTFAAARASRGRGLVLDRVSLTTIGVFGVVTVLGNYCVAQSLVHVDAGVTSVLHQTQILFVVLGGWLILRERVSLRFGMAMVVVLGGIVIMRIPVGEEPAVGLEGVLWGLASSFWFAFLHLWTRRVAHRIDPVQVNALRLWLAVALLLMVPGNATGMLNLPAEIWLLCALGAFAGPFVSRLAIMFAVRYITAAQSSMITLTSPLFAFFLDYTLLGVVPGNWQMVGAVVVLLGVALPIVEMMGRTRKPASPA